MKIFWTKEAEATFAENISYLEREWNADVIENFILKTENILSSIKKNPFLFPVVSKEKNIHKCIVVKQVSIYYKIKSEQIDLLTFWNNFQNPKKLKFK